MRPRAAEEDALEPTGTNRLRSRAVQMSVAALIAAALASAGCYHGHPFARRHRGYDDHHHHGKHHTDRSGHGGHDRD
jgi:hypothetical protein